MPSPFETTKYKIANRILPVARPVIAGMDFNDLTIPAGEVHQIIVPFILPPLVTSNQALEPIETFSHEFSLSSLQIESLIDWLQAQLHIPLSDNVSLELLSEIQTEDKTAWFGPALLEPIIETIELLATKLKPEGKNYKKKADEGAQPRLIEEGEICQHGMQKKWCADCRNSERKEREKAAATVDLFDLILPTLHPPLGENFDNPIALPPGKKLHPFQCEGIKFLLEHKSALLGDEMGLGKSIQTIIALRLLFHRGDLKSGLLLCPKAVVTDWETKFWEWAPELRVQKVRASQAEREVLWDTPAHIYLTTYESFREDLNATQARTVFDVCILDEIQKIKNPTAKLSQAVQYIQATRRWGLSGTPLENKIEDIPAIFSFLTPTLFSKSQVMDAHTVRDAIKPYFLRRRKSEALPELPPKVHNEVWLDLLPSQQQAYDRAENAGITELRDKGETTTVQHIFALITKLKQICNLDPSSNQGCKLDYLLDKVADLVEQGDKALIFSQFPEKTLKALAPQLADFVPLSYDGSLSDAKRKYIIKQFQDEETNKIMLISVKAGGVGITLTRASYVFHYDLWWNPSVAAQAEDRAHRMGQEKTVFVTSLFTHNTIEARIKNLLDQKRALFSVVVDELTDTDLTKLLTEEEIFGLFNLEKPKRRVITDEFAQAAAAPINLRTVSPQDFERLIGRLYEKMGYAIRMTPISRDGGIDVYATKFSDSGTEQIVIQCKHYPLRSVTVEVVRSLYGVMQANPGTARGMVVTSGEFSADCYKFADGKRIELVNGTRLLGLLEKYKVTA